MQRGATAVIFDVSENPEAIDQVGGVGGGAGGGLRPGRTPLAVVWRVEATPWPDSRVCPPPPLSQLNQGSEDPLKRPVVYVKGADAVKLMNIVNKQKVARARIQHRPPPVRLPGHLGLLRGC